MKKASRCRRKRQALATRTIDLHGIDPDGHIYLWQAASAVLPVSRFKRLDGLIVSGHYVLDWDSRAVTVHCGNLVDGRISLQVMCGGVRPLALSRADVESMLLGRVVPDPAEAAAVSRALLEARARLIRDQTAPHLRRTSL